MIYSLQISRYIQQNILFDGLADVPNHTEYLSLNGISLNIIN